MERKMTSRIGKLIVFAAAAVAASSIGVPLRGQTQSPAKADVPAPVVLVELFTSEGCSDCPPADTLLRQIDGKRTSAGQLIVGISEHVTYWDRLGWKDPFSSELFTHRQEEYGQRFGLDSVYTPQIVVNGREQLVGSDGRSLLAAFAKEASRSQLNLRIQSAQFVSDHLEFRYSVDGIPADDKVQLIAVVVDDTDQSNVTRGENSGRNLTHAAVARAFFPLGALLPTPGRTISVPLPSSMQAGLGRGHHLIVFAQQSGGGAVLGVDTRPI
jgi:hypothetical protein